MQTPQQKANGSGEPVNHIDVETGRPPRTRPPWTALWISPTSSCRRRFHIRRDGVRCDAAHQCSCERPGADGWVAAAQIPVRDAAGNTQPRSRGSGHSKVLHVLSERHLLQHYYSANRQLQPDASRTGPTNEEFAPSASSIPGELDPSPDDIGTIARELGQPLEEDEIEEMKSALSAGAPTVSCDAFAAFWNGVSQHSR